MNKPVNFEIAKLLKDKGFDELCNNYYSQALFEGTNPDWEGVFPKYSVFKHSDYHYNSKPNSNDSWFECSAPTIAEVVMWLYEKHDVWIYVIPAEDNKKVFKPFFRGENITDQHLTKFFGSPTDAYEAAITYCLENLIQGGNNEN